MGGLPLSRDLSVGERIRAYRQNRGLTREQLAQLVGRSEHWLYLIERGLRQPARYSDLMELARVLQTTVADLIGRQEAARPDRGGDQLGPLRAVLAVPDTLAPVPDDAVDLDELRVDVRQLDRMAWASRLDELTPVLPEVLGRSLPTELAERRARYYIDVARAQALRGHRDEAVETLLRADRVMPGELRRHVAVRELVRDALRRQRRRSVDSDLARLARTVGVLPASR